MEIRRDGLVSETSGRIKEMLEKNLWLLTIIIIGAIGRVTLALLLPSGAFDMFAFVALLSLSAGYVTRRWIALLAPLGMMAISDIFIYMFSGKIFPYSSGLILMITLFVWSGFAMAALLGKTVRRSSKPSPLWFAAGGVWSVVVFDIWTNIGWWLGPFYPNTLQGLGACMLMGVPFMIWHMVSTIALLPVFYAGVWAIHRYETRLESPATAPLKTLEHA